MQTARTLALDEEFDLTWRFDGAPAQPEALRRYVEQEHPHLLRVYDAEFLVKAIENARGRRGRA